MFYFEEVTSTVLKNRVEFTFAIQSSFFFEDFVKFLLDEHRIYCYNLSRMTA